MVLLDFERQPLVDDNEYFLFCLWEKVAHTCYLTISSGNGGKGTQINFNLGIREVQKYRVKTELHILFQGSHVQ